MSSDPKWLPADRVNEFDVPCFAVTNDTSNGDKIRLGFAQHPVGWEIVMGDIDPSEIDFIIPIPKNPTDEEERGCLS